jgi:hypothetical protein
VGTKYNYHLLYIFYIFRHISIFPSVVLHVFIEAVDTEAGSAEGGRRKSVKVLLTAFYSLGATFVFKLASVVQPLEYIYIYIYI